MMSFVARTDLVLSLSMASFAAFVAPAWAHAPVQLPGLAPPALTPPSARLVAQTQAPEVDEEDEGATPAASAPIVATPTGYTAIYHHRYQVGISLMPGVGYRIVVPYQEDQDCLDSSGKPKRVCTARTPFFLEGQVSFGLTERLDLIVDVRFGLERDNPGGAVTGGAEPPFALAPGLRFWLDQDVAVKFFATVQGVYDYTRQLTPKVHNSDFGFRNANGLMWDPIRNLGIYVQFAETIGFRRWFRIELDAGLGVQVRFP